MSIFFIIFVYFLLGSLVGTTAGLLGIGGGVIVVPALAYIFHHEHNPNMYAMHIAVGTSLAIMVSTTLRSLRLHLANQDRSEFWVIAKLLMPSVMLGVIAGAFLADFLNSNVLKIIFGCAILLIALRILLAKVPKGSGERALPQKLSLRIAGSIMGLISGLLGVGGGTTVIPYMLYYQVPMRSAVRLAIFVGLIVSIIGSISYMIAGLNEPLLPPQCWGYVYWPAWLGTSIGSVFFAPLGVRLSYYLPSHILKRLFACLLVIISIHMLLFN